MHRLLVVRLTALGLVVLGIGALPAAQSQLPHFNVKTLAAKGMALTRDAASGIHSAAAEVQVGTAIDFAVTLPPGAALVGVQIFAKGGAGITANAAEWKACDLQSALHRCSTVPVGYADDEFRFGQTDAGMTFQARVVPDSAIGPTRARLVVFYKEAR